MPDYERPGVYVSYELSSISGAAGVNGIAGVAAYAATGNVGETVIITAYAQAVAAFGADTSMCRIIKALFENGAESIYAVRVDGVNFNYAEAFGVLTEEEPVKVIVCDSSALSVQQSMRDAIESAGGRCAHKLGVVELDDTVSGLVARAEGLNSERMVLVAPALIERDAVDTETGAASAAFAGVILSESDPARPFNGAVIRGFGGTTVNYTDTELNLLVRGGVSVLETVGGETSIVRAVTTRTKTGGAADATWRELNTTLIIDDVIPTVRDSLRAKFARSKNTAQTRDAIRSQVIMELERKHTAEIIDSYGAVTVAADSSDPTVCQVSFEFTVAHGLNQIHLTAYITV